MDEAHILLKPAEAGARLKRSISWLAKARMTGNGPEYLKIGGSIFYRQSDLGAYLERQRRRSTSDDGRGAAA